MVSVLVLITLHLILQPTHGCGSASVPACLTLALFRLLTILSLPLYFALDLAELRAGPDPLLLPALVRERAALEVGTRRDLLLVLLLMAALVLRVQMLHLQ